MEEASVSRPKWDAIWDARFARADWRRKRNLTSAEMVAQVMYVQKELDKQEERLSHIVVMGTGEPFDNYDNVMNFLSTINHDRGLAIGARHITISTCGIVPMIYRFADAKYQYNLAISLHAPNNTLRDQLMPVNHAYPLDTLMEAIRYYCSKTIVGLPLNISCLKGSMIKSSTPNSSPTF